MEESSVFRWFEDQLMALLPLLKRKLNADFWVCRSLAQSTLLYSTSGLNVLWKTNSIWLVLLRHRIIFFTTLTWAEPELVSYLLSTETENEVSTCVPSIIYIREPITSKYHSWSWTLQKYHSSVALNLLVSIAVIAGLVSQILQLWQNLLTFSCCPTNSACCIQSQYTDIPQW